jgi:hypothetical protein
MPALLISVAAAMVVSRVGKEQDIGARSARRSSTRRGAGHHGRHRRRTGPDAGHAEPRVPAHRRGHGAAGLVAATGASKRAAALRTRPEPAADRPPMPRPAGTTWCRWTRWAWRWATPDRAGRQGAPGRPAGAHQGRAQEVRAGRRLPAAGGAHPRQPGAQAQHVPRHAARRRGGRGRGLPGHVPGHQPRWRDAGTARHQDHRPGLRPARGVDRREAPGDGTDGRIYGG